MNFAPDSALRTVFIAFSTLACPAAVYAQTASDSTENASSIALPSVVVTADKIERPLEMVPASVAVIDGQELELSGITSMEQLESRIAGLSFQPFGQAGMKAPVMRGVTAGIHSYSSSVLLLVDDVPTLMAQGFENSLLDVDRVEVLRGPQSTLYGRNAETGVVAIHSQQMEDTPRATLTTELGSRDKRDVRFALSGPLVANTLYGSFSGSVARQSGFIHNTYTGGDEDSTNHKYLNLGLRWTPTDADEVVTRYTRQDYNDGAALWGNAGQPSDRVASTTPSWNRSLGQTFSINASHLFDSGLRLRSITAYNDYQDKVLQDSDFTPVERLYIGRDNHMRTLSQEFRVEGQLGRADWLVGIYGDHGNNDLRNFALRSPVFSDYGGRLKTDSVAFFTHWNVPLNDDWSVSAGARIERMSAGITPTGGGHSSQDWTYVSPKLSLQYQINASNQWYISASRGVRAGSYNIFVSRLNYPSYSPEDIWSYETGLKGWALDKQLRYSLAAYVMKIDNMQVQMQPAVGVIYTASAAKATSKGVELDLDYLLGAGWQVTTGVAFNHTTYDSFQDGAANYAGNYNTFAPRLNGHVDLRYTAPQRWYAQGSVVGTSKIYLDAGNRYERNGYGLLNLVVGYPFGQWEVAAYANNTLNKKYDAEGYNAGYYTIYSPPRELGARLTWHM